MKLLPTQKDEIFDLIDRSDYFTPSQFELFEINYETTSSTKFKFRNSDFYFSFFDDTGNYGAFVANYSPGDTLYVEATSSLIWKTGILHFNKRLSFLKREVTASNKWFRLANEIANIQILSENEDSKFSYQEYLQLTNNIEQIKGLIKTIPLLIEQQNAIAHKLDHLTELAKELNKFDWKSLFIGTITSIIIQLGVTKENAIELWALIKRVFNNYFLP